MDAFRLRFLVFNLELNEGLDAAYTTGHDIDEFDAICDHLIVEHAPTGKIVGTYRLQTGAMAFENAGFYSEREFDFSPFRRLGDAVIELGRACVHRDHRSTDVLYLLWRGIAQYAIEPRWPVSDRLFFANLARPGPRYSSVWGHARTLGGLLICEPHRSPPSPCP